jgi:hypothetical protein
MLNPHDVGVAVHYQRRGGDGLDLFPGNVLKCRHPRDVAVEHFLQSLGVRVGFEIRLLQRLRHRLQLRIFESIEEPGLKPIPLVRPRCDDQLAHQLRMPDRDLQARRPAVAEAQKIRLVDSQLPEQLGHIIGVPLEAQGAIDVRRMPMSLKLHRDNPPRLRQLRQNPPETGLDGRSAAM